MLQLLRIHAPLQKACVAVSAIFRTPKIISIEVTYGGFDAAASVNLDGSSECLVSERSAAPARSADKICPGIGSLSLASSSGPPFCVGLGLLNSQCNWNKAMGSNTHTLQIWVTRAVERMTCDARLQLLPYLPASSYALSFIQRRRKRL
jgi:hypothetical protein